MTLVFIREENSRKRVWRTRSPSLQHWRNIMNFDMSKLFMSHLQAAAKIFFMVLLWVFSVSSTALRSNFS